MRIVTVFTLVLSAYWSNVQTLSLEDIFKVRTLDSTTLRTFASEKGYELREIDMDNRIIDGTWRYDVTPH